MRKEEEEAVSNLPTKGQSFGDTNSVSSEVFADTGSPGRDRSLGLLGCLGGFRLDRGLWLLGSFNIFTIVTTNLCNSNMFRDQHFGDVSWGDPNSQRLVGHETQYSREALEVGQLGRNDLFGGSEPADSPVSLVREVFEPGGGPAVRGQGWT